MTLTQIPTEHETPHSTTALDSIVGQILEEGRVFDINHYGYPRGSLHLSCVGKRAYYARWVTPSYDTGPKANGVSFSWALAELLHKLREANAEAGSEVER